MRHFILWRLGLAKPWTYYSEEACRKLSMHAKGKKNLAEIGCWQGVNTARLRESMDPDGRLYAIDPYPVGRLGFNAAQVIAHREVAKVKNGHVYWIRVPGLEAAKLFSRTEEEPFDFIFSDSDNSYEGFKKMWEAWTPLVSSGGIFIIANSHSTDARPIKDAGSVKFTEEVILKDPNFEHLESVETFTIMQKK